MLKSHKKQLLKSARFELFKFIKFIKFYDLFRKLFELFHNLGPRNLLYNSSISESPMSGFPPVHVVCNFVEDILPDFCERLLVPWR